MFFPQFYDLSIVTLVFRIIYANRYALSSNLVENTSTYHRPPFSFKYLWPAFLTILDTEAWFLGSQRFIFYRRVLLFVLLLRGVESVGTILFVLSLKNRPSGPSPRHCFGERRSSFETRNSLSCPWFFRLQSVSFINLPEYPSPLPDPRVAIVSDTPAANKSVSS